MKTDATDSHPSKGVLLLRRWVAWRRPRGGPWRQVCEGDSEAEATAALFDMMARDRGGAFDSCILPSGERP